MWPKPGPNFKIKYCDAKTYLKSFFFKNVFQAPDVILCFLCRVRKTVDFILAGVCMGVCRIVEKCISWGGKLCWVSFVLQHIASNCFSLSLYKVSIVCKTSLPSFARTIKKVTQIFSCLQTCFLRHFGGKNT